MQAVAATLRKHWPVAALLASATMLAGAHAFQAMGYEPCSLCLRQREVYWAAIAIAAAGLALPQVWKSPLLPRAVCALLGGAFLVSAAVAAYHAGVEWKWWPGPIHLRWRGRRGAERRRHRRSPGRYRPRRALRRSGLARPGDGAFDGRLERACIGRAGGIEFCGGGDADREAGK